MFFFGSFIENGNLCSPRLRPLVGSSVVSWSFGSKPYIVDVCPNSVEGLFLVVAAFGPCLILMYPTSVSVMFTSNVFFLRSSTTRPVMGSPGLKVLCGSSSSMKKSCIMLIPSNLSVFLSDPDDGVRVGRKRCTAFFMGRLLHWKDN